MISEFPKISYDYRRIALTKVFEHPDAGSFIPAPVQTPSSKAVFGELGFPAVPRERVYTMASFVTSIDGKIAYLDNPAGPVIAQSNALDPDGAAADFWILNLMRANADAIFIGAGTMQKEPDGLVCIFDQELEDRRAALGMPRAPLVIICSLDGSDIPFSDTLIKNQPVLFNTSPEGLARIQAGLKADSYTVGPYRNVQEIDRERVIEEYSRFAGKKIPVIVTGEGRTPASAAVMRILTLMGVERALVESPSYLHSLLRDGLVDEISLNYSCVYVGGSGVGLGGALPAFTSREHPHTEMLSIHMHSPSFFYFRHRWVHQRTPAGYMGSIG
jgi:riboflavin biosynthesis pyrimidine reductase